MRHMLRNQISATTQSNFPHVHNQSNTINSKPYVGAMIYSDGTVTVSIVSIGMSPKVNSPTMVYVLNCECHHNFNTTPNN